MNTHSLLFARIGLAAALALLAAALPASTSLAAAGDQTATVALTVTDAGSSYDALQVFFGENLTTRGLVKATMTVNRTIKGKVETSKVTGVISPTNASKLQFLTNGFTFSDKNTAFATGDKVEFTVTLKGKAKVTVNTAGIYDAANPGVKQRIAMSSFKFNIDPDYTVFNDLDILSGSDSQMTIENLQFMSDLTPDQFALLDPASLLGQPVTSAFTLSSSQASSPSFPTSDFFPSSITEPALGNYDVAEGLVFDPDTGDTDAFLDAVQAVPEPGTLTLLGTVLVCAGVLRLWRHLRVPNA